MIRFFIHLFILACLSSSLLLSGCSMLAPVKIKPKEQFTITKAHQKRLLKRPRGTIVFVSMTTAGPDVKSTDMLYMEKPYHVERYAQNEWVAPPAELFNQVLVESLQNTKAFKSVVGMPYTGMADWRVDTQLVRLYQDFSDSNSHIEMVVAVQVINNLNHTVVANHRFQTSVPTMSNDAYGGVIATNMASHQLLKWINAYVVRYARIR